MNKSLAMIAPRTTLRTLGSVKSGTRSFSLLVIVDGVDSRERSTVAFREVGQAEQPVERPRKVPTVRIDDDATRSPSAFLSTKMKSGCSEFQSPCGGREFEANAFQRSGFGTTRQRTPARVHRPRPARGGADEVTPRPERNRRVSRVAMFQKLEEAMAASAE